MKSVDKKAGYDVLTVSNYKIIPVNELDYEDNKKVVTFDKRECSLDLMITYVKKNQRQLIDYFIQGRNKNCQSYISVRAFVKKLQKT